MNILELNYDPKTLETHWRDTWERHGCFKPKEQPSTYSMVLPPPNVTGSLHMGHGFQQTLMDIIIRYQRMNQQETLWQGGVDHAGIATQMVVERQLLAQNTSRHDLGREAFVQKTWEWKEQSGAQITEQIRQLGASIDWSRERFTMDEAMSEATNTAFCTLYNEGLIYRGKRLVNWDTALQTAISDLEVVNQEKQGKLYFIRYPLVDNPTEFVEIATTRPETLLGDVALAVNPNDERYKSLIGKYAILPICNRHIPIIADEYVTSDFGSGCVKITPGHDFNDYDVGKRHGLEPISIFDLSGHCNQYTPAQFQGLSILDARTQILQELEQLKLLMGSKDHTLQIPTGDRSGTVIEPMLTDQWFIRMQSLAEPALAALDNGSIHFIPAGWGKTYRLWLENIQDWCISRQLWWGHRIPAYFDDDGKIYVGADEAAVRKAHKLTPDIVLTQDEDVLDTWFTSALWPFATLGWPHQTSDLKKYYPTQALVTGFDIIFFWVARMVMFGLKFMGEVPFKDIYIHGLIRDSKGQKMSKSKGNVLDPLDLIHGIDKETLIQKRTQALMQPQQIAQIIQDTKKDFPDGIEGFGTDALRFTFCALASTSRNINFDLGRIEGYRNFCNKLYNAARFVLHNCENFKTETLTPNNPNLIDQWIISQCATTIKQAHQHIAEYRFDLLAQCLYEFVWNDFCDWYLELAKCVLYDDHANVEIKHQTQHTLLYVLNIICRLLHPIIPFITETIWSNIKNHLPLPDVYLMEADYPKADELIRDNKLNQDIAWVQQFITECRKLRSQLQIKPKTAMPVLISNATKAEKQRINTYIKFISTLANISRIDYTSDTNTLPACAHCFVDALEIHVPLANLIDHQAEIARISKHIQQTQKDMERRQTKLANPNFKDKAPAAIVAKEELALNKDSELLNNLHDQLKNLKQIATQQES